MTRIKAIEQSRGPLAMTEANWRKVVAGEKWQTRRVLAIQPPDDSYTCCTVISTTGDRRTEGKRNWLKLTDDKCGVVDDPKLGYFSPKYQPGEIYYLPEAVRIFDLNIHSHRYAIEYLYGGSCGFDFFTPKEVAMLLKRKRGWFAPTTARFMLKSFAREFVRIKSVKIERLQDITEDDAIAEGCDPSDWALGDDFIDLDFDMNLQFKTDERGKAYVVKPPAWPIRRFKHLFNSIHGAGAWGANPWVWAYEFERLEVAG